MRQAINELKHVLVEHCHLDSTIGDITTVVNKRDMLEIVQGIEFSEYSSVYAEYEGDYFVISSSVIGRRKMFFIENLYTDDNQLKIDETEILIIPHYLPAEIEEHIQLEFNYQKLIVINETSTYEEIIEKL